MSTSWDIISICSILCPTSLYFDYILVIMFTFLYYVYIYIIISTFSILCPHFLYYVQLLHQHGCNSSNCLPCRYEQKVLETNPSSFISINVANGWFKRLFVSYGAWIEGFRATYRPLMSLHGIFLKDRYKYTLLATTIYDNDNRLFPLDFCVCDIEDEGNWDWFLQRLRKILYEW